VDVVKGPRTDEANVDLMGGILKKMDRKPVVFKKFVFGYFVSRLRFALQREVFYLFDYDYLSP